MRKRTYLDKKSCNIILKSEFCKSEIYLLLYNHIKKYKRFSSEDVLTYPELKKYVSTHEIILRESRLEWIIDQNPSSTVQLDNPPDCTICPAKKLLNFCRLRNQKNNDIIYVGTECAKNFEDDQIEQIGNAIRNGYQIKRIHILEEQIPDIKATIEQFKNQYDEYLLPTKIYTDLTTNYDNLTETYNGFIKKKGNATVKEIQTCIDSLNKLLLERKNISPDILQYIHSNQQKWNFPTPSIITWINRASSTVHTFDLKNKIRETHGLVTELTVHRIFEPKFMKTVLSEISKNLHHIDFIEKISNANSKEIKVQLFFNKQRLTVRYDYSNFILNLGVDILYKHDIHTNFTDFIKEASYDLESYKKILDYYINKSRKNFREIHNPRINDQLIYNFEGKYYFFDTQHINTNLLKIYFEDKISKEDAFKLLIENNRRIIDKAQYNKEEELHREITRRMS
ncbi:hypothetical protein AEA09_19010 [Lysinibacillus contaminans]|uniref:Uncharacterized protein n=1 Tax=Lysinibacillus contaminans TaxID=1293441 RepID=A0ABR5JVX1_9BACI|nr:hypothetical protein [Lysinibacillus contaminans]KOS66303.1 hypothetical protein AEA09_19010 [Lysinibacillus contaminans]